MVFNVLLPLAFQSRFVRWEVADYGLQPYSFYGWESREVTAVQSYFVKYIFQAQTTQLFFFWPQEKPVSRYSLFNMRLPSNWYVVYELNEKTILLKGAYFYYIDKILAIFDPPSPLVDKHRQFEDPP